MEAKILLFLFFASSLLSTSLVDTRFIPNRIKRSEDIDTSSLPFLRNLEKNAKKNSNHDYTGQPTTLRLKGDTELGYYYVTLFFGTPPQKQTLIIDTGSTTTTIPCIECGKNCGTKHFDQPFNHTNSLTFELFKCDEDFGEYTCYDCLSQCPFGVSYVEGSSYSGHFNKDYIVYGNEVEDFFHLIANHDFVSSEDGEPLEPPTDGRNNQEIEQRRIIEQIISERKVFMPFGCTYRETKLFYEQEADGILGLGVQTNSRSYPPNLLDAINLQNDSYSRGFSICLAQEGGYLTVGGYNNAYHKEKIYTTKFFDEFEQYRVVLGKIEVDGKDLGLSSEVLNKGEGAFFDSGTTMTHIPLQTYNAILEGIDKFCTKGFKNCGGIGYKPKSLCWVYDSSLFPTLQDFYDSFTTIKFYFGEAADAEYEWKPEDYLYQKSKANYCIGLSHYERETILGGTFMKNHDVMFDKENKQIQFARADCTAVSGFTSLPVNDKPTDKPSETPEATPTTTEPTPEAVPTTTEPTPETTPTTTEPTPETTPTTEEPTPETTPTTTEPTPEAVPTTTEPKPEPVTEPKEENNFEPTAEPKEENNTESLEKPQEEHKTGPADTEPVTPSPNTMIVVNKYDSNFTNMIIIGTVVFIVVGISGSLVYLYIRYRRKKNYNNMSSVMELPSAKGDNSVDNNTADNQVAAVVVQEIISKELQNQQSESSIEMGSQAE